MLRRAAATLACTTGLLLIITGCSAKPDTGRVIFLDGAGHFGASSSVKRGLQKAGYAGEFEEFRWSSFLLWGADHLVTARLGPVADRLAQRIQGIRKADPDGYVALMCLSASSNVVLSALERLPDDVHVDCAVLFQPSVSCHRNLAPALRHVKKNMYVTSSPRDAILAGMLLTADGHIGKPAGRFGFRRPKGITPRDRIQYEKLVNLRWRPTFKQYGWNGGHVSSTNARFVKAVIAPGMRSAVTTPRRRVVKSSPTPAEDESPAETPITATGG